MRVTCPSCNHETTISQEVIPEEGKSVTCPECKERFHIARPKDPGAARRRLIKQVVIGAVAMMLVTGAAFTYYKIAASKSEEDIKNELLEVIKRHIDADRDREDYTITYETEKTLKKDAAGRVITGTVDGWCKYVEKDNLQYEFNIMKTDSIIAPYTGTYSYDVVQYVTPPCPTKEAAFKSADYTYLKTVKHTLNYEYQSGHWILASDNWQQKQ